MNDDYVKARQEDERKRNKAVFKKRQDSDLPSEELELVDQVGLAFRKSALSALN